MTDLRRALAEPPADDRLGAVLAELGRAELVVRDPAAGVHLQGALELEGEPLERVLLALDLADVACTRASTSGCSSCSSLRCRPPRGAIQTSSSSSSVAGW